VWNNEEQALGKTSAIGPPADVYALGAVLYELLAGRPSFEGPTATDIERQVIADDPRPPSRYNGGVPRNLDTICLKCLHKNPAQRYAAAQDLADDLRRYLDGLPVLARPAGPVERTVKWARRRPALAALILTLVVALGAAVGVSVWLQQQRAARQTIARGIIADGIPRAYELGRAEQWRDARKHLEDVERHLAYADSENLARQVARARADIGFAEQLEHIRQSHALSTTAGLSRGWAEDRERADEYARAFAAARLDTGDVEGTAAAVRESQVREPIVTALDLWALAAYRERDEALRVRLLHITRLADPDPAWRDRFRDPAAWGDGRKLVQLADDAAAAPAPPAAHQLAIVSLCLHEADPRKDGLLLLVEARRRRPRDRWLTWELGAALEREKHYQEAVTCFRIVVAQRQENPWILDRLSGALCRAGQLEDAIEIGRLALDLEPDNAALRLHLAAVLLRAGQSDEAGRECRRVLKADPDNAPATAVLGATFTNTGRPAEALPLYRRALEIDPRYVPALGGLGSDLLVLGRVGEAEAAFEKAAQLDPAYLPARLGLSRTAMRQDRHEQATAQYKWLVRALDPNWASARSEYNLDPKALTAEVFEGLAVANTWLGRDADAFDATRRALVDFRPLVSPGKTVGRRMARANQLRALRDELPAILAGKEPPADPATRRALAEWLYEDRRCPCAAARLYEAAFAARPALAELLDGENRFEAGCAAAQAGCGIGEDAGTLDDASRTRLRKLALAWLTAERDAWEKHCHTASGAELTRNARTMLMWQECADLACVRDADALAKLPEAEMKDWQRLWADVKLLGSGDPLVPLTNARYSAAHGRWAKAAESYAEYLKKSRADNGEVWFEYAAVQLLAGDEKGYRETCRYMLTDGRKVFTMRPYHAARAATLAPNSVSDPSLAASVSAEELSRYDKVFWCLTEQAALLYRAGRYKEAVPLLQNSLAAEPRPGAAVLNWLWLAMAYQQLGEKAEARRWLNKATAWLDKLGNDMPVNADALNLHLHNWLEAQVLRREAEKLIGGPVIK
jgi:serine/threonine-protein kinase